MSVSKHECSSPWEQWAFSRDRRPTFSRVISYCAVRLRGSTLILSTLT